jgi:hypothetical protein
MKESELIVWVIPSALACSQRPLRDHPQFGGRSPLPPEAKLEVVRCSLNCFLPLSITYPRSNWNKLRSSIELLNIMVLKYLKLLYSLMFSNPGKRWLWMRFEIASLSGVVKVSIFS